MANRKRNIQMKFWITTEEKELIDEKMMQLPTQRYGAYLRKMAIDGYIIYADTTDIKEMNKTLSAISRNINQIAKRLLPSKLMLDKPLKDHQPISATKNFWDEWDKSCPDNTAIGNAVEALRRQCRL